MSKPVKGEWTDLQRKFVEHLKDVDCPSRTEAARRAGYQDPDSAVGDLMEAPHVRDLAFRVIHKRSRDKVKWRDLIEKAMGVLNTAMDEGNPDIMVRAASKVMDTGIKLGEASLAAGAEREDSVSGSREELAQAYLGMMKQGVKVVQPPDPAPPKDEATELLLLVPSTESEH